MALARNSDAMRLFEEARVKAHGSTTSESKTSFFQSSYSTQTTFWFSDLSLISQISAQGSR